MDEQVTLWRLRFMYCYTIIGAGGLGVAALLSPRYLDSIFAWPGGEPIVSGISGSVFLAFALLAALALRNPVRFTPVLILQLAYKAIWTVFVFLPIALTGRLSTDAVLFSVFFASYIVGDLVSVPFASLLRKGENA